MITLAKSYSPEYTGKPLLERFINQMESLLCLSGVPFKFWTTYFKTAMPKGQPGL